MNRIRVSGLALLVALTLASASSAVADDRFGLGIKAGTYGFGVDFGVTLNKWVALRASVQLAEPSTSETFDQVEYDGQLTLGGEGLLVDFYPMKGQFHLTGGVFHNRNAIDLTGTPTEPVEIGGIIYDPSEIGSLSGTIEFDSTVPYLGVGWGNTSRGRSRVRFVADLGVLFQGSGKVDSLTASGGGVSQGDLEAEIATIEDEIADYDWWPVVNLGLAIRF